MFAIITTSAFVTSFLMFNIQLDTLAKFSCVLCTIWAILVQTVGTRLKGVHSEDKRHGR